MYSCNYRLQKNIRVSIAMQLHNLRTTIIKQITGADITILDIAQVYDVIISVTQKKVFRSTITYGDSLPRSTNCTASGATLHK